MASQQDLLLAILSMDAYNRGTDSPGMAIASPTWQGGVTGTATAFSPEAKNSGFFAVSYHLSNGLTVISYRGTKGDGIIGPNATEIRTGWFLSLGFNTASQPQQALAYYNQIVSGAGGPANVILTGHSLGGGLAGFVADLYGVQADVFDNIPFGDAVVEESLSNSSLSLPLSSHTVSQFTVAGEIASYLRGYSLVAALGSVKSAYGAYLDNSTSSNSQTFSSYSGSLSSFQLHSASLNVLLMDAQL
ncbi:MAG: DUF2974 domain-containing protein, partial [Alphaproteobacteria bacterium]|nr:DUF2974 domain-containing protein [Alphaproteobacteria bacterium]